MDRIKKDVEDKNVDFRVHGVRWVWVPLFSGGPRVRAHVYKHSLCSSVLQQNSESLLAAILSETTHSNLPVEPT